MAQRLRPEARRRPAHAGRAQDAARPRRRGRARIAPERGATRVLARRPRRPRARQGARAREDRGRRELAALARAHVLEAEATLDAEVAARDVVVVGGGDLDDLVVLHVEGEVAADAAV